MAEVCPSLFVNAIWLPKPATAHCEIDLTVVNWPPGTGFLRCEAQNAILGRIDRGFLQILSIDVDRKPVV